MAWLTIPFSDTDEYASELVASARPGGGIRNAGAGRAALVGATQQGNCAMVAGAVLLANGFKVGDPTPQQHITVGMRYAVQRARRY